MKAVSVKNIKENTQLLNHKVLKSTKKVVLTSFEKIEIAQNRTDKFLKKGFKFSEKQQDNLFNKLEESKKMIWKNLNKTLDFFSKN